MIPKLFNAGKSFKSLGAYLLHDPNRAETSERIKWTHTLNLAADHAGLAIDEMLWTYRGASDLKREAGAGSGGQRLKNPVKHFSLNWHPSESPTREHMIEAVQSFLAHMKWHEHQALIVCHDDKHPHVHVMLNAVHPESGKVLDASFERRRAQEWAKAYEREHELIFCEERSKPVAERAKSPTREAWQKLRETELRHDKAELARITKPLDYMARGDDTKLFGNEWELLKAFQRKQREQFFIDGKAAFKEVRNEAYREVRDQFRGQWNAYYAAARGGQARAALASMKLAIKDAQNKALDERRIQAADELRAQRDEAYERILQQQRFDRAELGRRQDQGLRTYAIMDLVHPSAQMDAPLPTQIRRRMADTSGRASEFERSVRFAIDPLQRADTGSRPMQVEREARKDERAARAPVQSAPGAERTEASVERERIVQSRERNDQAAAKEQQEAVRALRASWNRARRSRGGRD